MPSHADNETEHRREHVRLALHSINGSVPSDEEVDDHIAEMDARNSHYGAFTVHTQIELERANRARQRREENERREKERQQEDEARQREDERERRRQKAEDDALAQEVSRQQESSDVSPDVSPDSE